MEDQPKPATASPKFDSLQQEAYLSLWRTYDRLKAIEEELFSEYGLSPQQYNALRLLKSVHPGSMPTLALGARLISRAPDMTRMLDRLENHGWIWRERKPNNRRVVEVGITSEGIELLRSLAPKVRQCHDKQLGHLTEPQLKQLLALLREVRKPHQQPGSDW